MVCRENCIKIDVDATGQGPKAPHSARIDGLQMFRMAGNVEGQKAQELTEHRIVFLGNFHAGENDLTAGTDRVVNFVPVTKS